jgi:mRNA interferase YafQ
LTARNLISVAQFRRDVKLAQRRGKDVSKLRELILLLAEGRPLPPRYRDHPLAGEWKLHRDCHLEPDWLLIYKIDGNDLYLVRTGTHSDLF